MTEKELNKEYFEWLYQLVASNRYFINTPYRKLFTHLHSIDFDWMIDMDGNRAEDGINLRYIFGYENNIDDRTIASYIDIRPCSVLEMIVALARRMETQIMSDDEYGNRTFCWFWEMITNLGLDQMYDDNYDEEYVDEVIQRFMYREYEPNGDGGLFSVRNTNEDLRGVEIWTQMNWHLNDVLESAGSIDIDI